MDADMLRDWAATTLVVPVGLRAGQPFQLEDWQVEWLDAAFADNVREAGLSCARKNGKTALIAALMLGHMVGPLRRRNWRAIVCSLNGTLSRELIRQIQETAIASGFPERGKDAIKINLSPYPGKITGPEGTEVTALAAGRPSGHAVGADLAICDEYGLFDDRNRGLSNAMRSAISARDGKFLAISVRGDGPLFSEMAERGEHRAQTHWQEYRAKADCTLDDEASWQAANPGLGNIKSWGYMRDAAQSAALSPADELQFRVWDLNQPLNPAAKPIVSVSEYTKCITDTPVYTGPVVVGIDLGGATSLTAAALYYLDTGALRILCALPQVPSLVERGAQDHVGDLYLRMLEQGCLNTYAGKITPIRPFLEQVKRTIGQDEIRAVISDRYRKAEAETLLDECGFQGERVWRGVGASVRADGSEDVRQFQRAVLAEKINVEPCLALESAIAQSRIRYDANGNPALDKTDRGSRIDALQAAVLAVSYGERQPAAPSIYQASWRAD